MAKRTSKSNSPEPISTVQRIENFLAYSAAGVIAVSLLSMFIALVSKFLGIDEMPALLAQLPLIGLPFGFILVMSLLAVSITRRSRENREGNQNK
jgi:hypothetical protein